MVHKSARILNFLVLDMLDLSNIINEKLTPSLHKYHPVKAVKGVISCYKDCAVVKNVDLYIEEPSK
jgi:hypothetical protein